MNVTRKISNKLEFIKKMELCPSILNLYVDRYSFKFFLNDLFSGIRIFLLMFPIAIALSFFCGASPLQGITSCAIAAIVSALFGGSKYQIASIALPVCVITFEILSKYQYKGLFYTAIFVSLILIFFGILKISEVLKHISYSFIAALSVYVILSIIINQAQYILGVNSIQSSQGLLENFSLFSGSFENITMKGVLSAGIFIAPIILIKSFFKGFSAFFVYLILGSTIAYLSSSGMIPDIFEIKTIGSEMISTQSMDNMMTISNTIPSQTFLSNALNYAFVISIIIACEASFCTNISSSITGDNRLQTNIELVSTGIANFASIASGGLFVSPNMNFSIKNIEEKSKTIIPLIAITIFCGIFMYYSEIILRFIPINCISAILIVYATFEFFNKKTSQYFNIKSNESYIFWTTLVLAIYFGFIPATIVGFTISCVFFAKRMVKIKDATVHTTKNHDSGAIEFMTNKNGVLNSMKIPQYIIDKIEVIQISNVLFLNIAKLVEEALAARGKFPSVLIIYFNNVPYLDAESFTALKQLVKNATNKKAIVMVSGTNGMLLDILQQKAETEKHADAFGYIIPDFKEAIQQTIKRLEKN